MRSKRSVRLGLVLGLGCAGAFGMFGVEVPASQTPVQNPVPVQDPNAAAEPPIRMPPPDPTIATLVGRLDLEQYKATIKGLTQFGDRRQGTKRNRDAVDWIEAQLKSYGCTNTERITYTYTTPQRGGGNRGAGGGQRPTPPGQGEPLRTGPGGSTEFGTRAATGVASLPGAHTAAQGEGARSGVALGDRPPPHAPLGPRSASNRSSPAGPAGRNRRAPSRAECRAEHGRRATGSLLHEDRHDASERDVHRRRSHGRHRLGRGRQ